MNKNIEKIKLIKENFFCKKRTSLLEIFRLSARMFKTRKLRTFLTILGISVGIGTILFLVSLGYGLQNIILQRIATSEALLSIDVVPSQAELVPLNQEYLDKIAKIPYVKEISPLVNISAQITMGELTGNTTVNAVKPSYFRLSGLQPKEGKLFKNNEFDLILVSQPLLKLFNLTDYSQALGKEIQFTFFIPKKTEEGIEEIEAIELEKKFKIAGILEEENFSYAFIPMENLKGIDIPNYSQAKVRVVENQYMAQVREKIMAMGFSVSALSDTIDQANKIFKAIQIVLAIFGIVALVVSAIGMFNTMTIALLERTQEIGIMKALGASNQDIWKLFITESVIMGIAGGLGGLIVGFVGSKIFNIGINILARFLGGQSLNLFYYPLWFILVIVILSSVLGLFTGLYPAQRASKLSPLEALRYK